MASLPGVAMAKFAGDQNRRNLRMKSPVVSAVFGEACIQDSTGKYFGDSGIQNNYLSCGEKRVISMSFLFFDRKIRI